LLYKFISQLYNEGSLTTPHLRVCKNKQLFYLYVLALASHYREEVRTNIYQTYSLNKPKLYNQILY